MEEDEQAPVSNGHRGRPVATAGFSGGLATATVRLVAAAWLLIALTSCGSGNEADEAKAAVAASAEAKASADAARVAANQAAVAAKEAQTVADMTAACDDVQAAAHKVQDSNIPAELRHEQVVALLDAASAKIGKLPGGDATAGALSLDSAVANYKLALLRENLTTLREYPGKTPDLSELRQQHESACVRAVGAAPIVVD
jgi:hypothetical protein